MFLFCTQTETIVSAFFKCTKYTDETFIPRMRTQLTPDIKIVACDKFMFHKYRCLPCHEQEAENIQLHNS